MKADIDRFRREIGTDYIDILLLHCMMDPNWPERKKGAMAVISEAREKGIVRTHGVSCHSVDALRTAARDPWAQVALARINPAGDAMDADPRTVVSVLQELKAAGYDGVEWRVTRVPPERRAEPPSFWGNNLCTLEPTEAEGRRARALAEAAGLAIPNLGTYIAVGDLAATEEAMRFAQAAGSPTSGGFGAAAGSGPLPGILITWPAASQLGLGISLYRARM